MTKRMLIDATHAEETRVVVLDDNKLEDFDVETSTKKQLKGNIYLAKIVRVEPSLQAAFVEYGGGRHGFLAFGEIHPDYYQIPVADRQRLLAMQAEEARAAEAEEDAAAGYQPPAARPAPRAAAEPHAQAAVSQSAEPEAAPSAPESGLEQTGQPDAGQPDPGGEPGVESGDEPGHPSSPAQPALMAREERFGPSGTAPEPDPPGGDADAAEPVTVTGEEPADTAFEGAGAADQPAEEQPAEEQPAEEHSAEEHSAEAWSEISEFDVPDAGDQPPPETVGGDDSSTDGAEDARQRRASRLLRTYRIQEVIHRRQIILVQVVKEERGTKGAALTTYISLAGRFSVLMPNSPRGGGISRKITSAADRKRLKEVTAELDLPQGMGLIVRTAGANRPKPEIRRDCEYLMRLWDDIREHTLRSVAPSLIYEEASLIKRAIRDVYSRDIDDIIVDGEEGWRAAHEFMRMLMPSHARKVQMWRAEGGQPNGAAAGALTGAGGQPLFAKYAVESQLDAMLSPTVQLKSGGYLVIDQTEALVAIDVNSGRSTRERNIEETALRTNLEAADEAARQLRLRDLAGLIVIDFIDMESRKNNAAVEKRLKDALKVDRARIQVGHISHFGLLEMSRQRLRPSLAETSFDPCPHCGGTGHVRNIDSSAISVLRAIEDEGGKAKASVIMVHATGSVVMYLLNNKRDRLSEIEGRFGMRVQFASDDALTPGQVRIDRVRPMGETPPPRPAALMPVIPVAPAYAAPEDEDDLTEDDEDGSDEDEVATSGGSERQAGASGTAEDGERRRKRRRRRRGGRREGGAADGSQAESSQAEGGHDDAGRPEGVPGEGAAAVEAAAGEGGAGFVPAPDAATHPDAASSEPETAGMAAESGGQPSLDPADLDENGLPRARRRGRRGGRRRRREGEEETATQPRPGQAVDEPQASHDAPEYAPPPYTGPTPANPFGGDAFDIFDMIDLAGEESTPLQAVPLQAAPLQAAPLQAAPLQAGPVPASAGDAPMPVGEPVAPELKSAEPENVAPEFSEPDAAPAALPEPELPAAVEAAAGPAERAPLAEDGAAEPAEAGPEAGSGIRPVVIGEGEPAADRKRGWWRR